MNRAVAIRVLPAAFAEDPERFARFASESQTLAPLHHPNIATIYVVEERARWTRHMRTGSLTGI